MTDLPSTADRLVWFLKEARNRWVPVGDHHFRLYASGALIVLKEADRTRAYRANPPFDDLVVLAKEAYRIAHVGRQPATINEPNIDHREIEL